MCGETAHVSELLRRTPPSATDMEDRTGRGVAASPDANGSDEEWLAMNRIRQRCVDFVHDESGQELIEYALVVGLLVLGTITAMSTLSGDLSVTFNSLGNSLSNTT